MLDRLFESLHLQNFGGLALFDILLLAFIIYQLLLLIRGTRSVNILDAIAVLVVLYVLTGPGLIPLTALHSVLGKMLLFLPIAVVVLFQTQIRQALANLGKNPFSVLLPSRLERDILEEISLAAASLASKRLGALIVIERDMGLRTFSDTGIALDALVSYDLLLNIFTRNSPLHDGAVVIAEGRIRAASCFLPLTTTASLSRRFGTRHRAAVGITEESDALAVVVSEERGVVSLADGGKVIEDLSAKELKTILQEALAPKSKQSKRQAGEQGLVITGSSDA